MVPTYNKYPSRGDERIDTTFTISNWTFTSPIISANMDTITGPEMAMAMRKAGGLGILHRFCSIEENVKMFQECYDSQLIKGGLNYIGVSIGVNEGLDRAKALYDVGARIFCVDVAHGHSKACGTIVYRLKELYGDEILIIAGNVCTPEGVDYLIDKGADMIKVGI
jgi:IMP dehydrogenase